MEIITEIQCRHPGCGCRPREPFHPFCSAYCRNVVRDAGRDSTETEAEGACACGHAGCTERLADVPDEAELVR